MAKTSGFGFTNTTLGSNDVDQVALGLTTNYALMVDNADQVRLNNKTAPLDAEEIITIRSRDLTEVKTYLTILNPTKIKNGIEYGVRVDDTLRTSDSSDPNFAVDEPIVCSIAVRHPKSGNITAAHVATVFQRALSVLMRSDGTWRFDDLMRSAERPVTD